MSSYSKTILIGNLGADPESKYLPSGGAVTNIRVATTETWKDKQSGELQERTEWHRVVLFNRPAEFARDYLRKGSQVFVEGQNRTRKWQGNDGQDRYTTEIHASKIESLGGKPNGAGKSGNTGNGGYQNQSQQQGGGQRSQPQYQDNDVPSAPYPSGIDDDRPF